MSKKEVLREILYLLQPTIIKVLEFFRNACLIAGIIGCFIGICALDTEDILKYIMIEIGCSVVLICASIGIEYFKYKYFIESDYLDWLEENDLDDTSENYDYYYSRLQ